MSANALTSYFFMQLSFYLHEGLRSSVSLKVAVFNLTAVTVFLPFFAWLPRDISAYSRRDIAPPPVGTFIGKRRNIF